MLSYSEPEKSDLNFLKNIPISILGYSSHSLRVLTFEWAKLELCSLNQKLEEGTLAARVIPGKVGSDFSWLYTCLGYRPNASDSQ